MAGVFLESRVAPGPTSVVDICLGALDFQGRFVGDCVIF